MDYNAIEDAGALSEALEKWGRRGWGEPKLNNVSAGWGPV